MPRTRSVPSVRESLSPAPARPRDEESLEAVSTADRNGFERPSNAEFPQTRLGVGYLRRSTDRQEQSIGDQRAAVERFAAERGIRLLRHYVDDGVSGTSTAGRQAFQQLIADAERHAKAKQARRGTGGVDDANGGFDVVVCYDVKRFGRVDNDEAGYYRHILKRCGVEVMYASEGFTGGMVDDLLRPVTQWQARQESKDLAKVVIRGLVSKATPDEARDGFQPKCAEAASGAGGWWMGGAPPYGYDLRYESMAGQFIFTVRYERDGTKRLLDERGEPMRELAKGESVAVSKRDRCKLVLGEPERAGVVKDIFRMYTQERKGFKAVASALNRRGVPTARSKEWAAHYSGRWSITTVRAILMNPAYCGDLAWNRRTDARFYRISGGRAVERDLSGAGMMANSPARRLESNDEADWIVTRDAHEPIVARRVWEEAREIIRSHDASRPPTIRAFTPRTKTSGGAPGSGGGGWGGERTKFLLSGLVKCGRCGNAYEGRIDRPSKANAQGEKSKSYAYVCGGYLRHGKSVCARGLIPRDELERKVIEEVVKAYRPFMGRKGRARLEQAMLAARGGELNETREARRRASQRLEEIAAQARTLLDNLSEANRVFVDERLRELTREREELERRVESLDRLAMSDREFQEAVREEHAMIEQLDRVLNCGQHEERRAFLERAMSCVIITASEPLAVAVRCAAGNISPFESAITSESYT
ncbi:MAG: recombinase family protein [Phycisphaerales bacterium]